MAAVDGSDPLLAKTQAALLQQALAARLAAEEAVREHHARYGCPSLSFLRGGGRRMRSKAPPDRSRLGRSSFPQLRDKRNELKLATAGRETLGVELYSVQQQLQRLAEQLHGAEEERFAVTKERNAAEQALSDLTQQHSELVQEAQSAQATVRRGRRHWRGTSGVDRPTGVRLLTHPVFPTQAAQLQADLDRASQALRGAETAALRSESAAAVAARTAQATDGLAGAASSAKSAQDALLTSLARQLEAAHGRVADAQAALEAHRQAREVTVRTLQRVNADLASTYAAKKELLSAWTRALGDATRADDALSACRTALGRMQDARLEMVAELRGAVSEAQQEEQDAEAARQALGAAQDVHSELASQLEALQQRLRACGDEQRRLEADLSAAQREADAAAALRTSREAELKRMEESIRATAADVNAVQQDMLLALADSCTAERGAQKLATAIQEARKQQAEVAVQIMGAQEDILRSRAHQQRSQAYVDAAAGSLAASEEELARLVGAVATAEAGLKRSRDAAERTARETEKLDKRLDALLASRTETDLGPLEATVANLSKAIAAATAESRELQRTWIGLQTQLVALAQDAASCEETSARLRGEKGVLQGKAQRLLAAASADGAEVKDLQRGMDAGHVESVRLADAVATAQQQAAQLEEDTVAFEAGLQASLDPEEASATALEAKVVQLEQDIVAAAEAQQAAEAEVGRWEEQVVRERETQQALDPNVGGAALVALRKETHRLELRRSEAAKRHAALNAELARAVARRDTLVMKSAGAAAAAAAGKRLSPAAKALAEVDKQLRDTERECAATAARIDELRSAAAALEPEAAAARRALDAALAASAEDEQRLGEIMQANTVARAKLACYSAAVRYFDDLAAGRATSSAVSPAELAKTQAQAEALRAAANALGQAHGEVQGGVRMALAIVETTI